MKTVFTLADSLQESTLSSAEGNTVIYKAERGADGQIIDFRLVVLNKRTEQLLQCLEAESIGKLISQLFSENDAEFLILQLCVVMKTGRSVRFMMEHRCEHKGTLRCYDLLASKLADGVVINYEEIQQHKRWGDPSAAQSGNNVEVAEQPLPSQQQAEFTNAILNSVTCGVVVGTAIRNADNQIEDILMTAVNQRAADRLGFTISEMVGQRYLMLYPGIRQTGVFDMYIRTIESGEYQAKELYYNHDGLDLWVSLETTKLGDGVVVTWTDISNRKQAELALQQQKELLTSIQNASQSGISALKAKRDASGTIVDFEFAFRNETVARITGRSMADTLGKSLLKLYPHTLSGMFKQFAQVVETGQPATLEQHYNANGEKFPEIWLEMLVCRWGDGIVIDFKDITGLRLAEREKIRQGEHYKILLDTALTSITMVETVRDEAGKAVDFRFMMANQAAQQQTGFTEQQIIGHTLTELFPGSIESGLLTRYMVAVDTRQPQQFEMHYPHEGFDVWNLKLVVPYGDGLVSSSIDITQQKKAELAARQQTELLESIQNSSQTGITAMRSKRNEVGEIVDFVITFRNSSAVGITGKSMDESIGKSFLNLYPNLKRNGQFDRYVQVVEAGRPVVFEEYYSDDKLEGWFNIAVSRWGDGITTNYYDVTNVRKTEREKVQQAAFLDTVLNNIMSGVLSGTSVRGADGQLVDILITTANQQAADIANLTVADMVGHQLGKLLPGIYETDLFALFTDTIETRQPQTLELYYGQDGLNIWLIVQTHSLGDGLVISYTDITQQKQGELAARQQADLLDRVMNTTPEAILVHDTIRNEAGDVIDFRMTQLNQTAADMLGNPIEKVKHRRVSTYFPGLLETPLFGQYKQVVATGEPIRIDVPWADRWYDFSVARFGDGLVVAARDVTPTYQYRHQLEVANYDLKRSNDSLESFAFIASHDLQEPLRKITSFSDVLHTQYAGQFDAGATDIIRRINSSAERMRLLIHDLLTYARVDTHREPFRAVHLDRVIQSLQEDELWAAMRQTKARVDMDDLPVLIADPLQMRQLFQNLLSNAFKFCPRGKIPVVTITSKVVPQVEMSIGLVSAVKPGASQPDNQPYHEISIADNGIGFDEKYIDRIFQVFQRLHGKSTYAGSGIGLSICQKIIERHNGAITVSSKPEQGSIFRVYLPV